MPPTSMRTRSFDRGDKGDGRKPDKLTEKVDRYKRKACDGCRQSKARCVVCPSQLSILNEADYPGRESF